MKQVDWRRWKGWRGWVTWTLGAICCHIYFSLPWPLMRRAGFLLPRAGDYIYWDQAIAVMRDELGA